MFLPQCLRSCIAHRLWADGEADKVGMWSATCTSERGTRFVSARSAARSTTSRETAEKSTALTMCRITSIAIQVSARTDWSGALGFTLEPSEALRV